KLSNQCWAEITDTDSGRATRRQSRHRLADRLGGAFGLSPRHVQVRAGPQRVRPAGMNEHAALLESAGPVFRGPQGSVHFEPDQVRLDFRRYEPQPGRVGDSAGDELGVAMVLRQAFDVMVEGVERGGGEDTHLAHAAAEELADLAGAGDQG